MCSICVVTLNQGLELQRYIRPKLLCTHSYPGVFLSNLVVHVGTSITAEHPSEASPNWRISTRERKTCCFTYNRENLNIFTLKPRNFIFENLPEDRAEQNRLGLVHGHLAYPAGLS